MKRISSILFILFLCIRSFSLCHLAYSSEYNEDNSETSITTETSEKTGITEPSAAIMLLHSIQESEPAFVASLVSLPITTLFYKKMPVASLMFQYSFWRPSNIILTSSMVLSKDSLQDEAYLKQLVAKDIADRLVLRLLEDKVFCDRLCEKIEKKETFVYEFNDNDLHFSLQHLSCNIVFEKDYPNHYKIVLTDIYDFTQIRSVQSSHKMDTILNNLGVFLQRTGMIRPYNISISFLVYS